MVIGAWTDIYKRQRHCNSSSSSSRKKILTEINYINPILNFPNLAIQDNAFIYIHYTYCESVLTNNSRRLCNMQCRAAECVYVTQSSYLLWERLCGGLDGALESMPIAAVTSHSARVRERATRKKHVSHQFSMP